MNFRHIRTAGVLRTAAVAATAAVLAGGATALAAQPATPSAGPTGQPPNVTLVEQQVEAYYGGTVDASGHHHASADSAWGRQVAAAIAGGRRYLDQRLRQHPHNPAIVLDVDDTSEVTYGWEVDSQFAYNAASNEQAIDADAFPAIQPTLELAQWAAAHGVTVFFVTGRPEHQRAATLTDLVTDDHYPQPAALFLKAEAGTPPPAYLSCGTTCTTDQYKSQTRAHLQAEGYDIVLNVGDQDSDLSLGHEDHAVKLPNPMYFLP
ncbi:MAG TPA: HAD family acid phosphatase [Pseudonocardiaceae bacterium]|nr:HAD family acid phosphatase [Pseudonocardiaceae bacterium]